MVRRRMWHDFIDKVSSDNLRRLNREGVKTAVEEDAAIQALLMSAKDPDLAQKIQLVSLASLRNLSLTILTNTERGCHSVRLQEGISEPMRRNSKEQLQAQGHRRLFQKCSKSQKAGRKSVPVEWCTHEQVRSMKKISAPKRARLSYMSIQYVVLTW